VHSTPGFFRDSGVQATRGLAAFPGTIPETQGILLLKM
jgi:hypothetical protein